MADWSILSVVGAGLNRSHNNFAGIHAYPDLERSLSLGPHAVAVPPYLLLHSQRRIDSSLWMVLVGDRRPEQREDSIAGGLHDVTAIAMDGINHQLERGIDNGTRL